MGLSIGHVTFGHFYGPMTILPNLVSFVFALHFVCVIPVVYVFAPLVTLFLFFYFFRLKVEVIRID